MHKIRRRELNSIANEATRDFGNLILDGRAWLTDDYVVKCLVINLISGQGSLFMVFSAYSFFFAFRNKAPCKVSCIVIS